VLLRKNVVEEEEKEKICGITVTILKAKPVLANQESLKRT
jgi:hypothetical protein